MTVLDGLAERCGIEAGFRDAGGKERTTSAATKRRLLSAMGIAVADEAGAKAAIAALDRQDWQEVLPPVHVAGPGCGDFAVGIVLPAGTGQVAWRLDLEDGTSRQGSAGFASLPLIATGEPDGRRMERRRLTLPPDLPWGYHRLSLPSAGGAATLVVTPGRCWLPEQEGAGRQPLTRLWGVAAQLYLLCSAANWGIGDYTDLRRLVEMLAAQGADVVGLNPLHALFPDDPDQASPYSPLSRVLLNVLNIDIGALPELATCPEAQALLASEDFRRRLAACRDADLVDYAGVTALKLPVLRLLHAHVRADADPERRRRFVAFRQEGGAALRTTCLFQALRDHFAEADPAQADWHAWPEAYRRPDSPEIARFADAEAERLDFHAWLQFLADSQLAEAAAATRGMAVGLYRDLAVGADPSGAASWSNPAAVVSGARIGAPPDLYNPAGQDWGLPPLDPRALRREAYRSFITLVRANMRHAGGLRIDHVMALQHLYWVPEGGSPTEGAYVRYPLDDLVGILALESHRHRCLVVGEDLGTVPEGFRARMAAANILSYRVLFFEKDETGFLPPDTWPERALAVAGSHDLPTLRGWWEARDIGLKERLHLYPDKDGAARAREERRRDREALVEAFRRGGFLPAQGDVTVVALTDAAHAWLARSRSLLALAQLDDITGEADQVNVPATSDEHPNWRRKLSLTLEELAGHPRLERVARIFNAERGRGGKEAQDNG